MTFSIKDDEIIGALTQGATGRSQGATGRSHMTCDKCVTRHLSHVMWRPARGMKPRGQRPVRMKLNRTERMER
ncbi:hypothetical protein EYF80_059900 [Liparis tanakae]|uniref:Uncharacterized protein n=1 Tax=Liparis tanakae TaxID=230148 RepID=A0A4Z2EMZ2_9TELE|nr:hypothetical protein EYF80_059900 [Liparis tanakae]